MWRYFRSKDYAFCIVGALSGFLLAYSVTYLMTSQFYPAFTALHVGISVAGIMLFRFLFKSAFITLSASNPKGSGKRTMIVGAGTTCELMMTEIKRAKLLKEKNASARYDPVCVVDDDPAKIGKQFEGGVTVVGTTENIPEFVKEFNVEQIIFAIPSCPEEKKRNILDICQNTKVNVKVIPFIGDLIFNENKPIIGQLRDIRIEDLLGRDPISFDNKDIKAFISGKVCMVTGGGGSIGSELVRQIAKFGPKQIVIVDIYENNAYEIQQELVMEYGDSLNLVTLIASVRDYHRMNQIYMKYKPQIVFHAAAHKHVPLMEVSPMEAIKNNVIGTFNVATLAEYHGVEKFVMISTDKAVNPTNVMGASKRCCEMVIQYLSQQPDTRTEFVTTRFGNVLGSNGSVIPLFKKQIERGGPVTVTHPEIIRYFMTIPEAVNLVMEAAAIAHGGEIFVLDMGQPVKIVTLAENLIRMYGKVPNEDIDIVFTGLRPGEKIREELLMMEEGLKSTQNKLIFIGKQIEIDEPTFVADLEMLKLNAEKDDEAEAVAALHRIVPTFTTPEEFNRKELHTS
ncbi:MAG: polysaccharide biosynthesis protein [Ruminococcus sp.]|nr:polysaccharide biosynthesis protein [Ruminococcus sp.]